MRFASMLASALGALTLILCAHAHAFPGQVWRAKGTGYFPSNDPIEGGYHAAYRNYYLPSHTLQAYLRNPRKARFVAVAMDPSVRFGTKLRIPELERKYHRRIVFEVVDRGGAFQGTGTRRIDICVANRHDSYDATVNGSLHLVVQ